MQHVKFDHIEIEAALIAWAKAHKGFNPEPGETIHILLQDGGDDATTAHAALICGVLEQEDKVSS